MMKQIAFGAVLMAVSMMSMAASGTADDFKKSFEAAEAARVKAGKAGGEWRDTKKVLEKAKAEADKGDFAKGIKLANKAKFQAETGYQQAMDQKGKDLTPPYLKK
jgi:opacity protein-like surface antigen